MVVVLTTIVFHRGFRGSRRRSSLQVVQSFKKVINHAPASRTVTTVHPFNVSFGVDSVAAGQTSPTDVNVPTGSVIKNFESQFSVTNLTNQNQYFWVSIQRTHSGQAPVSARAVGGHPQRNQVFRLLQFMVGQSQNSNHVWKFKVPAKYGRVREGDAWVMTIESDVVFNAAVQHIYKFYR